jgi:crossover junction endodeoxyribonuclease RuvC
VVEQPNDGSLRCLAAGAIRLLPQKPLAERLQIIFDGLRAIITANSPDVVAIEEVFYATNAKSALKLGQVRGVAMLTASSSGLPVAEYAPLAIKAAVAGYGRAEKVQVQYMVQRLLKLPEIPRSSDAADALAIAICHLHTAETLARQAGAEEFRGRTPRAVSASLK